MDNSYPPTFSFSKVLFIIVTSVFIGFSFSFLTLEVLSTQNAASVALAEQEEPVPQKPLVQPDIIRLEPENNLVPGDTIRLTFNIAMATGSSPISSDAAGEGVWVDPMTYDFTLGEVGAGSAYSFTLLAGTLSQEGAFVTVHKNYQIHTAEPIQAAIIVINDNESASSPSPIEISFNQNVDHVSAERSFSIRPKVKGVFSWDNDLMIFTPGRLDYQTTYTVNEASGVMPVKGFSSTGTSTLSFTTAPEVVKLSVPYFQQQFANSCEAAALRMALAFYGISTSDMNIVEKFGYRPRAKDEVLNIWDDPQKMFVGSIDNANAVSGYGVYGTPVVRAAEYFGRSAAYETSITPQFLAQAIKNKHPVLVWGYTSLENPPYTWNTPDGTKVTAFKGEHVRVIVGVEGKTSDPLGFYLHDPINGGQYEYWSTQKLMDQIHAVPGVTNQAVVIK